MGVYAALETQEFCLFFQLAARTGTGPVCLRSLQLPFCALSSPAVNDLHVNEYGYLSHDGVGTGVGGRERGHLTAASDSKPVKTTPGAKGGSLSKPQMWPTTSDLPHSLKAQTNYFLCLYVYVHV